MVSPLNSVVSGKLIEDWGVAWRTVRPPWDSVLRRVKSAVLRIMMNAVAN